MCSAAWAAFCNANEERFGGKATITRLGLNKRRTVSTGPTTYYDLGLIGGARTFMVRSQTMGSGGPGGTSLTVYDAIQTAHPPAIIMVGIAFGVDDDKQHIGDVLPNGSRRPL